VQSVSMNPHIVPRSPERVKSRGGTITAQRDSEKTPLYDCGSQMFTLSTHKVNEQISLLPLHLCRKQNMSEFHMVHVADVEAVAGHQQVFVSGRDVVESGIERRHLYLGLRHGFAVRRLARLKASVTRFPTTCHLLLACRIRHRFRAVLPTDTEHFLATLALFSHAVLVAMGAVTTRTVFIGLRGVFDFVRDAIQLFSHRAARHEAGREEFLAQVLNIELEDEVTPPLWQ